MISMRRECFIRSVFVALMIVAVPLAACAGGSNAKPTMLFDGRFDDWPPGATALADPWFLYFRLSLPTVVGLQAAYTTTELLIDLDDDKGTGRRVRSPAADGDAFGVELALLFAPREGHSAVRPVGSGPPGGAAAVAYAPDGSPTELPHQAVAFAASPTHESDAFELRVARHELQRHEAVTSLRAPGRGRAIFRRLDADGVVLWESGPLFFERPAAAATPARAGTLPTRADGTLRIMSVNVRRGGPLEEPEPLARIVTAVDPDVVLLQEWDQRDSQDARSSAARTAALAHWFDTHVPGERPWRARRSQAHGVAIVARHELSRLGPDRVFFSPPAEADSPDLRTVRYIAARVDSPLGPVAVASIHLSCCGAPGSVEDRERAAQAAALHAAFSAAVAKTDIGMVVIGGDFNLVGEVRPRTVVATSLDLDGSALAVAPALAPGDRAATTWRDPRSRFSPSQLDFLLYSDATAELRTAFVADTATLSEAALLRTGLLPDDAAFSDHLAVVIDLRRRDHRVTPARPGEVVED